MDSESSQILLSSVVDCSGSDFQWEKPDGEKVKIAETELKQPPLQECEKDIQWFRENFIGKRKLFNHN